MLALQIMGVARVTSATVTAPVAVRYATSGKLIPSSIRIFIFIYEVHVSCEFEMYKAIVI